MKVLLILITIKVELAFRSKYLLVDFIVGAFIHPTSPRNMGASKLIWLVVGRHTFTNSEKGFSLSSIWTITRLGFHHRMTFKANIFTKVFVVIIRLCGFCRIITGGGANSIELKWDFWRSYVDDASRSVRHPADAWLKRRSLITYTQETYTTGCLNI